MSMIHSHSDECCRWSSNQRTQAKPVPRGFTRCDECEGDGHWRFGETEQAQYLASQMPCPTCFGSGLVPTEKLREDVADTLRRFVFEVVDITRIDCADAVLAKVAEHLGGGE